MRPGPLELCRAGYITSTRREGTAVATSICPACGYPTIGAVMCALCRPVGVNNINPVVGMVAGVSDFNPAA
jgi:hypothetical protein